MQYAEGVTHMLQTSLDWYMRMLQHYLQLLERVMGMLSAASPLDLNQLKKDVLKHLMIHGERFERLQAQITRHFQKLATANEQGNDAWQQVTDFIEAIKVELVELWHGDPDDESLLRSRLPLAVWRQLLDALSPYSEPPEWLTHELKKHWDSLRHSWEKLLTNALTELRDKLYNNLDTITPEGVYQAWLAACEEAFQTTLKDPAWIQALGELLQQGLQTQTTSAKGGLELDDMLQLTYGLRRDINLLGERLETVEQSMLQHQQKINDEFAALKRMLRDLPAGSDS